MRSVERVNSRTKEEEMRRRVNEFIFFPHFCQPVIFQVTLTNFDH